MSLNENYTHPVSQLLALGDVRGTVGSTKYLQLGLTEEHVPELIRMMQDDDLHWADGDSDAVWAPLHAWRASGVLADERAIEPMVALLSRIDEFDDDWVMEDLPDHLAKFGGKAIPAVTAYLADSQHAEWGRISAAATLRKIGRNFPATRDACVASLREQLAHARKQEEGLNGYIISYLTQLKGVEAIAEMERAFKENNVDISVMGDWEDVQIELGLLDKRISPPEHFQWLPEAKIRQLERIETERKEDRRRQRVTKAKTKAKRKQAKKVRKKQRKKKR